MKPMSYESVSTILVLILNHTNGLYNILIWGRFDCAWRLFKESNNG